MVTPKQANADITSVKKKEGEKGRRGGRWGRGGGGKMNIKKRKREINRYRSDEDNGRDEGRGGRGGGKDIQDVNNNQQRTESQGKAKISVRRPVVNNNNNNNITAT